MAFSNFLPAIRTQQAQNARSFKIWDESIWVGQQVRCTSAIVQVSYYDQYGILRNSLRYPLIIGANRIRFNEYLGRDGHEINVNNLYPLLVRFPDGYYIIRITFNDGTYVAPNEPFFDDHQAFLAKIRCMSRKMPLVVLPWPDMNREKILDTHKVTLLLSAAEDAADLGKRMLFDRLIRTLNRIFDRYSITECF